MSRSSRIAAEAGAAWRGFVRRRTAVFFTFFFPAILIVIFGALVGSQTSGLFAEPATYYVPGYLAVVVLLTPLSRVSSTVARHRDGNRFEKLATTPLSRLEWLFAHAVVNAVLVGAASAIVLTLLLALAGVSIVLTPWLVVAITLGVWLFCGVGALLGRLSDSRDGAIAASNGVGLPLLFLSETFISPELLPAWFRPVVEVSPLTYFARASRAAIEGAAPGGDLLVLLALAVLFFALGAFALPWRQ